MPDYEAVGEVEMIEIKRLCEQDIGAVYAIECKCFSDAYGKDMFKRELQNKISYYVTAWLDGTIAGYAGIWRIADEAELISIAVAPEAQRCGVGRALLKNLLEACAADGIAVIRLEVRRSNLAAQRLYTEFGFIPYGVREKYYGNAEDAILMMRQEEGNREDFSD